MFLTFPFQTTLTSEFNTKLKGGTLGNHSINSISYLLEVVLFTTCLDLTPSSVGCCCLWVRKGIFLLNIIHLLEFLYCLNLIFFIYLLQKLILHFKINVSILGQKRDVPMLHKFVLMDCRILVLLRRILMLFCLFFWVYHWDCCCCLPSCTCFLLVMDVKSSFTSCDQVKSCTIKRRDDEYKRRKEMELEKKSWTMHLKY